MNIESILIKRKAKVDLTKGELKAIKECKKEVDKKVAELKERIEGDCFSSDSACVYPVLDLDKIMKAIKEVFE